MAQRGNARSRRITGRSVLRRLGQGGIVLIIILLLFVTYATVKPLGSDTLVSRPDPTTDYATASARWSAIQAHDGADIDPRCRSWSLLHGQRTARVVVLLHGYTNCPFMYRRLGQQLYDLGWNVLAPRFPYHGYVDKLTSDTAKLTAEDLVGTADETVDVAVGMGERVIVGGISAGGVAAAWVAQNRPDVDRVVGLAPLVNLKPVPGWFAPQVSTGVLTLPDVELWWDPETKAAEPPDYGYPRLSSRAVATLVRLGMVVLEQARQRPPEVDHIVLTTNPGDGAVNSQTVGDIVGVWQSRGADASIYQWAASLGLTHNMVDDVTNASKFDLVYPILGELFTTGE